MTNSERIAQNIFRGTALLFLGEISLRLLAGDAPLDRFRPPAAAYADCAKQPGASASVQFDALRPRELFVGDVQTDAAGRPEAWRTVFDIETLYHDLGEIGVAVQGFGPVVRYEDLPKDGAGTAADALITSDSGARLNMSQAPHPDVSVHAPVLVTFTCGPAGK